MGKTLQTRLNHLLFPLLPRICVAVYNDKIDFSNLILVGCRSKYLRLPCCLRYRLSWYFCILYSYPRHIHCILRPGPFSQFSRKLNKATQTYWSIKCLMGQGKRLVVRAETVEALHNGTRMGRVDARDSGGMFFLAFSVTLFILFTARKRG